MEPVPTPAAKSKRIAAIDWMRGFVMILMIFDHASMSFDRDHIDHDSALYADAGTMFLPAGEFFTRWMTHLCAPTFVFLAGTALALSIERRVVKGAHPWEIDKNILLRGAIIVLLDVTVPQTGVPGFVFTLNGGLRVLRLPDASGDADGCRAVYADLISSHALIHSSYETASPSGSRGRA